MPTTGEIRGVGLAYVARRITGKVIKHVARFEKKEDANVLTEKPVTDPVIVFMSNGTSQILSYKRAEELGFLRLPKVLNLAQVEDGDSPAARYKNAIRDRDRLEAWMDMELAVINRCIAKTGHPLPLDADYSKESIYFEDEKEQVA